MHQYSLHANAASPSFFEILIFSKILLITKIIATRNPTPRSFSIPWLINYASEIFDLMLGDVIATGTPAGVGFTRKPPMFLAPGDVVEVEVEKIGVLRNPVVDEAAQ
jgi:hypothetical protein